MKRPWSGKTVLITSGPTREHLDPIRYLTNASSGRMGFALAAEAARLGAKVVVVSGPTAETPPRGVRVVPVVTGLEMRRKTLSLCKDADAVIGAAAVSDWRFAQRASHKMKRSAASLNLTLVPNPDIIKEVAGRRVKGQVVVGFALETRHLLASARGKLQRKNLDLVVANGPASLAGERSRAVLVRRDGRSVNLPPLSKTQVARMILKTIEELWREQN